MRFLDNKYIVPFIILFYTWPLLGFCQKKETINDSLPLNNAALFLSYYKKYHMIPPDKSKSDSIYWEKTLIILNNERILSKEDFLQFDENKILSIKEILNSGAEHQVERVLLLKSE